VTRSKPPEAAGSRLLTPRILGLALSVLVLAVVLLWVAAPDVFTAYDPTAASPADKLSPPSGAHPFGTDHLGRDLLSRVIHGSRDSMTGAIVAVLAGLVIGLPIGLVAGANRGLVDAGLMRAVDTLLAIPGFLLALTIVVLLGFSTFNAAIAVGASSSATFARLSRSEVLRVMEAPYVEAAVSHGLGFWRILGRHVLPNSVTSIVALVSLQFGIAILWIASLSFLGFGAQPPDPEWGLLLSEGRNYLASRYWLTLFPGAVVVAVVLAFSTLSRVLGDRRAGVS
jgi:peptide/nickel transport system permease protein